MRPSSSLFRKLSASSARWLSRQNTDPYVRLRTASDPKSINDVSGTYRSRSAFKLVSLSGKYPQLLGPGKTVIDLGAAPGGWSQVATKLSGKMMKRPKRLSDGDRSEGNNSNMTAARRDRGKVIALDILPIEAIDGVHTIQGDFLSREVRDQVRSLVGDGGVDTVLSDMMGSMTGVRDRDVQMSLDLCMAAWEFGRRVLKTAPAEGEGRGSEVLEEGAEAAGTAKKGRTVYPGGNMVLKFFAHPDLTEFKRKELLPYFATVAVEKPKESRSESSEAYFVCLGFKGLSPPAPPP